MRIARLGTRRRSAFFGSAAIILLASGGAAHAQDAAPAADAAQTATVEEVIVTAQRREERLVDVPMSIAAVTGETIEESGVRSILELSSLTPGVQVNFAGAATQPAIRGVTSLTNAVGYENNVAIYIDGYYTPDMLTINSDLANVESLQVLKGPQGALYGRNATGGAILINTKAPTDSLEGKIELSYAELNDRSGSAYVSGPITDRIGFSVAGYERRSDGYLDFVPGRTGNPAPLKQQSVRTKLQADVTEDLTAILAYNYGFVSDPRGLLFTAQENRPAAIGAAPPLGEVAYNYDSKNQGRTNEYTLTVHYDTPIGRLSSYSGYSLRKVAQEFDLDGSYIDLGSSFFRWAQNTYQQTVDLSIDTFDKVDLIVGASYFDDNVSTVGPGRTSYGPNRAFNNKLDLELETRAYAVYADATYQLTDALSVSAGGRYSSETKKASFIMIGSGAFPLTEDEETFSAFTPRAAIRYELAPRTNVYASYARGFRSGAFPATITAPRFLIPIEQEIIDNYEVGFKTNQGRYSFDAAVFHSIDKNLQVSVRAPLCVNGVCTSAGITLNAPEATVTGAEAQLTYAVTDQLQIRAGAAYLRARYGDFPNASGSGLNPVTNLNANGQEQDWSNQEMARAPEMTWSLGVDYTVPVSYGELSFNANANYSDSFVISNPSVYGPLVSPELRDVQRFRTNSYVLVNAQAGWTDPEERYSVRLFVQNLTDEDYLMAYNGSTYGSYKMPNTPRQFGIRVGYAF